MKKVALVALVLALTASQAFATSTSVGPINVSTSIDSQFSLTVSIYQDDITVGELPVALSFVGPAFSDHAVLRLGAAFESLTHARKAPRYFTR